MPQSAYCAINVGIFSDLHFLVFAVGRSFRLAGRPFCTSLTMQSYSVDKTPDSSLLGRTMFSALCPAAVLVK